MANVTVSIARPFGRTLAYPVDNAARIFAELVRKKTLGKVDLRYIRELGYTLQLATQVPGAEPVIQPLTDETIATLTE